MARVSNRYAQVSTSEEDLEAEDAWSDTRHYNISQATPSYSWRKLSRGWFRTFVTTAGVFMLVLFFIVFAPWKNREGDLPPNGDRLGRAAWTLIHVMAANFPANPTPEDAKQAIAFITALSHLYPCDYCMGHFSNYLNQHPVDVSSREAFLLWTCEAHNDVRRRQDKALFPCNIAELDQRWGWEGNT
ncbi:hypothetical protein GpartN1_g6568.t1 [Galdieria partita]|uniref:Sulfhydryl oxidase n=1 Tax=Galdieria partita TaxID=83374 RepID=A0A9C7Q393_9RHOD|nr:hypothetical protein GpartN1_g6568.t1 [Galdieria partita]